MSNIFAIIDTYSVFGNKQPYRSMTMKNSYSTDNSAIYTIKILI